MFAAWIKRMSCSKLCALVRTSDRLYEGTPQAAMIATTTIVTMISTRVKAFFVIAPGF
jgi:hypothetical protein